MAEAPNSQELDPRLIERGGHVRAVLQIRRDEFPDQPAFESLPLPVLVATEDNPWAFTRRAHAPLWQQATGGTAYPCTYGYSPAFGLVVNATPLAGIARAYQIDAYESATFVPVEPGPVLWSSDAPDETEALRDAVETGRGMRVALTDMDGTSYSLGVHLSEVYGPRDIALYTDFEAIPAFALSAPFLANFSRRIAAMAPRDGSTGSNFGSMAQPQRVDFASLYFRLRLDGTLERWDLAARGLTQPAPYRRLVIVAAGN